MDVTQELNYVQAQQGSQSVWYLSTLEGVDLVD
jgi:hypothetical protein